MAHSGPPTPPAATRWTLLACVPVNVLLGLLALVPASLLHGALIGLRSGDFVWSDDRPHAKLGISGTVTWEIAVLLVLVAVFVLVNHILGRRAPLPRWSYWLVSGVLLVLPLLVLLLWPGIRPTVGL